MTPVVYTKPGCVACNGTKRKFDNLGIDYDLIDITIDHDAREYLLSQGFQEMPVVMVGDTAWSGYRPDRITALVA